MNIILIVLFVIILICFLYKKIINHSNIEILKINWKIIAKDAIDKMTNSKILNIKRDQLWEKNKHLYKKINNIEGWINSWTKDNDWINYPLIFNFKPLKTNLKKCLNTKNLLSKINKRIKVAGFSLIKPNGYIPKHKDGNSNFETYHLGLSVPDSKKCFLKINGKKMHEKNGKLFKFNDSLEHEAFNNTNNNRIIFYILIEK